MGRSKIKPLGTNFITWFRNGCKKCNPTILIPAKFLAYAALEINNQVCWLLTRFILRYTARRRWERSNLLKRRIFTARVLPCRAYLLSDRRWKAPRVNFSSEFLPRIISPSSYNLLLPLAIVSTHSASPLAAPLALKRFCHLIAHNSSRHISSLFCFQGRNITLPWRHRGYKEKRWVISWTILEW